MSRRPIGLVTPLVEELGRFCRGHEAGTGEDAATHMLEWIRGAWPEVLEVRLPDVAGATEDPESLVLDMVGEIGELAEKLAAGVAVDEALGWARASLTVALETYLASVRGEH
jgi:hypothetical protein